MKKYLVTGILILAVAIAGMKVPELLFAWQDERQFGKIRVEAAQEVVLKEQVSMTLSQKMELLRSDNLDSITLRNGKNYTQDTVVEKAGQEVERLLELEILSGFQKEELLFSSTELSFVMDVEDSEKSLMFWILSAVTNEHVFQFFLDDESGKIFFIWQTPGVGNAAYAEAQTDAKASAGTDKTPSETKVLRDRVFTREELEKKGEVWADYLGCRLLGFSTVESIIDEEEEVSRLSAKYMKEGFSKTEAYEMAVQALGYPYRASALVVRLEDEAGPVDYYLSSTEEEYCIYFWEMMRF